MLFDFIHKIIIVVVIGMYIKLSTLNERAPEFSYTCG